MAIRQKIYDNKGTLILLSISLVIVGIAIAYVYYNSEPWETLGGFLCGIGFGLFLISVSLKQPQNPS